jgi:hypothetical protein
MIYHEAIQFLSSVIRPLSSGVVGLGGFEPPTSPLSGVRSNQLSYKPNSRDGGSDPNISLYHLAILNENAFTLQQSRSINVIKFMRSTDDLALLIDANA